MTRRRNFLALVVLLLLGGLCSSSNAGIRPSFSVDVSTWRATHIVVVTEGKTIDGEFTVIESWKGDLTAGDTIKIPELASFKDASARTLGVSWWSHDNDKDKKRLVVTGNRMVLFLKEDQNGKALERAPAPTLSLHWKTSDFYHDWSTSAVWIEETKVYGFIQVMNPGPSILISLSQTESELKNEVLGIDATHDSLLQAMAIEDPALRAEALAPFAQNQLYFARNDSFEALSKIGKQAVPVVRKLLADEKLLSVHHQLIETLAEAGEGDVGADLTQVVQQGIEYWKKTGPMLQGGWWNGNGLASLDEAQPFRDQYMRVYTALMALGKRPYLDSEKPVVQFRELWGSMPQLVGDTGHDQMTEASDGVLREIERVKSSRSTIRFEGMRVFGESQLVRALRDEHIMTDDTPLRSDQVEQITATLKRVMSDAGYLHATIEARDELSDANVKALTLIINEGEQVNIADIRFVGNKIFSSAVLAQQLRECMAEDQTEPKIQYDALEFGLCLRRAANFVRSKGYLEASLHDPEIHEIKDGLVVSVQVDEGIRYRLGDITISGAKAIATDTVRGMLSLQKGEFADSEKIFKWLLNDVKKTYDELGYIEYLGEAETELQKPANGATEGVLNLKVTIEEGAQFKVRTISFAGKRLPEKKLRSLLRLRPGDVFNQTLFEQGIVEMNKVEDFVPISLERDVKFTTDEEHGLIDILIRIDNLSIDPQEDLRLPNPKQ
ncbi:MAG TPA: POTRA domain-containing protein [Pyrinomonadaceae bacterium]|nr:POTRA domain-containing protein [Pyrinomonadaceae bacterium]